MLVNSNYSFALTHMMCKMNSTRGACECNQDSQQGELKIDSMNAGCCKTEIKEINNSNTLESNKLSIVKEISFITIQYFAETESNPFSTSVSHLKSAYFSPPTDIPILFSHILI